MARLLRVLHCVGIKNGWAIQKRAQAIIEVMSDQVDGQLVSYRELTSGQINECDFLHVHGIQIVPLIRRHLSPCQRPWGFEVVSERSMKCVNSIKTITKQASCCWIKNPRLAKLIREFVSVKPEFVPNGVDTDMFHPSVVRVGWAGNKRDAKHLDYKGVPLIQEAVDLLNKESGGRYSFVLDPSNYPVIVSQWKMAHFYRGLDVFVCASEAEGCSNVVNEAAACGVPVVSTRVGIAFELQKCGIVKCVDRSAAGIAEGIKAVVPKRLRTNVMENFRWDGPMVAGRYLGTYQRLLKRELMDEKVLGVS